MRTKRVTCVQRDERGAVLIVVAAFTIVAVIFLAFVVDVGSLRAERKEVTLSTDAAALAGVSVIDFRQFFPPVANIPCGSVRSTESTALIPRTVQHSVDEYLSRNGGTVGNECRVTVVSTRHELAYVTVGGAESVPYAFEGATGVDSGTAAGRTSAAVETGLGGGLRPFGMCVATKSLRVAPNNIVYVFDPPAGLGEISLVADAADDSDLADGAGHLGGDADGEPDVYFPLERPSSTSCGVVPGSFGQLDLAGNIGTNTPGSCQIVSDDDRLCDNTVNGYHGDVQSTIQGRTGNSYTPFDRPFDILEGESNDDQDGNNFWVPVFSNSVQAANGNGGGNNASFAIKYWMEVRPLDHCFEQGGASGGNGGKGGKGGNPKSCLRPNEEGVSTGWFKWKVVRIVSSLDWPTGPPLTGDAERYAPRICGLDDGDVSYCS